MGVKFLLVDNIERLCEERGISICALESAAGVANGTVWKLKNKTNPAVRAETVKKFADYFGVTMDYLYCGGETCEAQ